MPVTLSPSSLSVKVPGTVVPCKVKVTSHTPEMASCLSLISLWCRLAIEADEQALAINIIAIKHASFLNCMVFSS